MISNPAYADVMTLISDNALGVIGETLFGGEWGTKSGDVDIDEQVMVLEGPGTPSDIKEMYENPAIQILVRGIKRGRDIDVYSKAKAVSDLLLLTVDGFEINGTCYTGFEETSNIAQLGKDSNERFVYSMNFSTFRNRF